MLGLNLQDLLGSILAACLFPLVSLMPGYVVGWGLDLFGFRKRTRLAQYIIGIVLSNAVLPIFAYLAYRFLSIYCVLTALGVSAGAFVVLDLVPLIYRKPAAWFANPGRVSKAQSFAVLFGIAWVAFALLLLVDIEVGQKLYFANVSYDWTTRIGVIGAITRTGIPPLNPGYFPGHPVELTYLYYYWYILPSLIDWIGGALVDSRQAMIAGTIWSGLCLMATIGLYIRLRTKKSENQWTAPLIGIQLLLVGGLDFIPDAAIDLRARSMLGHMVLEGAVHGWNIPVMSWLNAITWVPNHVSAALECVAAMLLLLSVFESQLKKQVASGILAGICFASAFGTSTWVTLVFAVAWVIWAVYLFLCGKRRLSGIMAGAAVLGVGLSVPFILGLVGSGGGSGTALPIAFYIRPFSIVDIFVPEKYQLWANLVFLPVNYLMELGFFFVMGLCWFQYQQRFAERDRSFIVAESILLSVVCILLSFVYSTLIQINDLGIRAWLLGQFILLVWATDAVQTWLGALPPTPWRIFKAIGRQPRIGRTVQILLIIGLLTTSLEAFYTRSWSLMIDSGIAGFPNNLSPDTNLGARTFDAKLAYQWINSHLPLTAIVQYDPNVYLDRPSGLYGERQVAISDRTAYGVPPVTFQVMQKDIATIFELDTAWAQIDTKCTQHSIDTLVINDLDPLWKILPALEAQRPPLYQNQYYSVMACGSGATR